jgi:uncharacterized protein (TIGR03435 family)
MAEHIGCKRGMRNLLLLAVAISIAIPAVLSQANAAQSDLTAQTESPGAKPPEYDVASIKLNNTGSGGWSMGTGNDHFSATNVTLKPLLQFAYRIKQDLISGVPGSMDSAHFDIQAKVLGANPDTPVKLSDKQLQSMLVPILEDRFHLKAHIEIKSLPVFELAMIKGGPKFKQSAADPKHGNMQVNWSDGKRNLTASATPMEHLVSALSDQVNRTVIDKTGLTGNYDFDMKWTPDDGTAAQSDYGPGVFTAIQEQLGLKLQPAKGPVETLVVDHVEMPSAN